LQKYHIDKASNKEAFETSLVSVMKNPPWTDLGGFCGFGWENHYLFKVNNHNTNAFKDWCMFGGCMDTIKAKPFNDP